MFEIHVTVSCPDLLAAAQLLVKKTPEPEVTASSKPVQPPVPTSQEVGQNTAPVHSPTPVVNPTPAYVAGPSTYPMSATNAPVNSPTAVPTNNPVVPLAAAPTYTMAQIANAGAELIRQNPGLLPQVNALLAQHGVQAVTDIKPEQYGAFATALRGLGAKI